MKIVDVNSSVTVNYTGKLEDGSIFDSSLTEGREPLETTLGQGQLIKGFEAGLIDMSEGEKKTMVDITKQITPQNDQVHNQAISGQY